jgi:predicted outer membrane repeat protein
VDYPDNPGGGWAYFCGGPLRFYVSFAPNHGSSQRTIDRHLMKTTTHLAGFGVARARFAAWIMAGLTLSASALPITHYVDPNNTNPRSPYTTWDAAATNIQSAVDVCAQFDTVLVTNGIYQSTNDAVITLNFALMSTRITVQSVNGAAFTSIVGRQVAGTTNGPGAGRCINAIRGHLIFSGFTLTNGATTTGDSGGAVKCQSTALCIVTNCVFANNSADQYGGALYASSAFNSILAIDCRITGNTAFSGGGAYQVALDRCVVSNNYALILGGGVSGCLVTNSILSQNTAAWGDGGGAYGSSLNNCDVVDNFVFGFAGGSGAGGGAYNCSLNNCIVVNNHHAGLSDSNYYSGTLNYCCTAPLPPFGTGNITNDPSFADPHGDFHLQSNSACINAAQNAAVHATLDLDSNPRVAGATVDMGAYEFQSPQSIVSYAWLQQFGFATDGSSDFTDPDSDGMNNWQEWIAGTIPIDGTSLLQMFSPSNSVPGITVRWQSVTNRTYSLQRTTNLLTGFGPLQNNLPGQDGTTSYTDSSAVGDGPFFYRVGVQ